VEECGESLHEAEDAHGEDCPEGEDEPEDDTPVPVGHLPPHRSSS